MQIGGFQPACGHASLAGTPQVLYFGLPFLLLMLLPASCEMQFGKKLQAAMIRKLQESDVTTQWSLNYKLNSKLRMQFNITSAPPFPKTLMFQYSDS